MKKEAEIRVTFSLVSIQRASIASILLKYKIFTHDDAPTQQPMITVYVPVLFLFNLWTFSAHCHRQRDILMKRRGRGFCVYCVEGIDAIAIDMH